MGKKRKHGGLGEDNLVTPSFGAPLKQQASAKEEGDCPIAKKLVASCPRPRSRPASTPTSAT